MNRTPRLSKSGIEYLDFAWNFYSGCWNWRNEVCPVGVNCWAKKRTHRFKQFYPNGFEPTFYPEALLSPLLLKKPSIIGCAFMGDLFGGWVDPKQKMRAELPSGIGSIIMSLKGWIFTTIEQCPQHTFLFKTKCPQNLIKWSPFPDNCWVGVTVCTNGMMTLALQNLSMIEAKVKFISFEPLLGQIGMNDHMSMKGIVDWAIIGAQTKPYKPPKMEWVEEIVETCDKAGIPVFLKNNLAPILEVREPFIEKGRGYKKYPRQEMPIQGSDDKLE